MRSLKPLIKNSVAAFVWVSGAGPILRFFFEPRLAAVAYHAITNTPGHLNIPPQQFAAHAAYLTRRGYAFVTFRKLAVKNDRSGKYVAVYFDDGFRDIPSLTIPATFFLTTDYLDQKKEGAYVTWQEAELLKDRGEIGSHGVSHRKLNKMPLAEAQEEMARSRHLIEERLGIPITSFSYPYGRSSQELERAAHKTGFIFTTADKRFHKVRPDPGESLSVFKLKLLGIL